MSFAPSESASEIIQVEQVKERKKRKKTTEKLLFKSLFGLCMENYWILWWWLNSFADGSYIRINNERQYR